MVSALGCREIDESPRSRVPTKANGLLQLGIPPKARVRQMDLKDRNFGPLHAGPGRVGTVQFLYCRPRDTLDTTTEARGIIARRR
jgi:hypothetical protein